MAGGQPDLADYKKKYYCYVRDNSPKALSARQRNKEDCQLYFRYLEKYLPKIAPKYEIVGKPVILPLVGGSALFMHKHSKKRHGVTFFASPFYGVMCIGSFKTPPIEWLRRIHIRARAKHDLRHFGKESWLG